jgi:Family of unknown function (DUF6502)
MRSTNDPDDLRVVATEVLLRLFLPLTELAINAGLSINDLNAVLREAAVRSAANKQRQTGNRINISGIAASTGIPRAEISRILNSSKKNVRSRMNSRQQSTNRILAAWHREAKFTDEKGQPADLKLFGRGPTFDSLVKSYGRGIPTRAVLDELTRASAVSVLSSQRVRAETSLAVHSGLNAQGIKLFGDCVALLMSSTLSKMLKSSEGLTRPGATSRRNFRRR